MTARPAPLPMQEAPPGQMSAPRAGGDRVIPNFYPISCKTRPCMTAWGLQSIVDNGPDTCYIICPVVREGAD